MSDAEENKNDVAIGGLNVEPVAVADAKTEETFDVKVGDDSAKESAVHVESEENNQSSGDTSQQSLGEHKDPTAIDSDGIPEWLKAKGKKSEQEAVKLEESKEEKTDDRPQEESKVDLPKDKTDETKKEDASEQLEEVKEEETKKEETQEKAEEQKKKKGIFQGLLETMFPPRTKKADEKVVNKDGKKVDLSKDEKKQFMEAEKIYQEGLATIRDLIAPSSMEVKYDSIRLGETYSKTFYVFSYPRYVETNWMAPVVNFDVTMDISQFIYPIESGEIMKTLKKKVAQMQSSARMAAEKGQVRDPALETALEDAEQLRTDLQRGEEKFFQFAMYFTLYSEDEKKLKKAIGQLESLLGGKLIMTKRAQVQAEHGFNSTMPFCLDELDVIRNMNTSPLSSTFPFTSSDLTSNEGILYGINRHNESLIIFDRFKMENANAVVFAKSGAGKSYAVKLEILRMMMLGTDVIIIDPEHEYEELCQTVGGTYLKMSLNSDRRINPFDLPKPLKDEDPQPGDLLRSNILNIQGLLKVMLGDLTPVEEGMVDRALIDVYALKGITMDMVDPSEIPPPTMEDLYDILSTMEGAQNVAQRLQKYTSGSFSGIFNKETNIEMDSGLMVFCIRDLEDALRPIAMYVILNYIWNRVRSSLKRRMLVVDEAWTMMQHDDSAKFLFGLVKRARKYYLGVTTITQDVEDFVKNQYGKPIITNSSIQLLLKQAPAALEVLQKTFNLTEGEKYILLNSGIGQGLFFAGNNHVAIQIIASYSEDKIITTNPEEMIKAQEEFSAEPETDDEEMKDSDKAQTEESTDREEIVDSGDDQEELDSDEEPSVDVAAPVVNLNAEKSDEVKTEPITDGVEDLSALAAEHGVETDDDSTTA